MPESRPKFLSPALAPLYTPPGGPPQGAGPSREIYARMGEAAIFQLCEDFYAALEKSPIRILFSADMPAASRRLAAFFVGVLGGPPLYHEQYGDPRMRARHLAFPINEEARRIWVDCLRRTLADEGRRYGFPAEHLPGFLCWIEEFSKWMVNRR
jgi:hemoglobin